MKQSDELLARYLDGSLPAGERAEVERLLADDPDLAAEVRELQRLDAFLVNRAEREFAAAEKFRGTVKHAVRKELGWADSTPAARTAASTGNGKTRRPWYLPLLLVGGLAGIVYFIGVELRQPAPVASTPGEQAAEEQTLQRPLLRNVPPPNTTVLKPTPEVNNAEKDEPAARTSQTEHVQSKAEDATERNVNEANTPADPTPAATTEATAAELNEQYQDPARMLATVEKDPSLNAKIGAMIKQFEEGYAQAVAANNRSAAALTALKLAGLYRQNAQYDPSLQSARRAMDHAGASGLSEVKALALGEQGLVHLARGNNGEARTFLHECVVQLQSLDSEELPRWKKTLAELE